MKKKITIETEEDLLGDEFLANGELDITSVEGYSSIIKLETNGHFCYVDAKELKQALELFNTMES